MATAQAKSSSAIAKKTPSIKQLVVYKTAKGKPIIEKGIPIPPIFKMDPIVFDFIQRIRPTDSVFFPYSNERPAHLLKGRFLNQVKTYKKKNNLDLKFISRTVKGGIRIWRVV